MRRFVSVLACTGLLAAAVPAPLAAAPLERELRRQAPEVVKFLRAKGYENVGVLKFLVAKDGGSFSDNVGTLNLLLARRLELALILANDVEKPVGVIANASAVAATLDGANHLTADGRRALLAARYPLAWGDREVTPDALLTGCAALSKDLRTLTVTLLYFDRTTNELRPIGEAFQVDNQAERLTEMGGSFRLRSAMRKDGTLELMPEAGAREDAAFKSATETYSRPKAHPANYPKPVAGEAPVVLEVQYGPWRKDYGKIAWKTVPYEFRDGQAYLPEPTEKEAVRLVLRRDGSKERYGVALKVNGENTVGRERLPDLYCRKWILEPGRTGPLYVNGYQMSDEGYQRFRVLSQAESAAREVNYGADVGTITMTVFRERSDGEAPRKEYTSEGKDAAAMAQAALPQERPDPETLAPRKKPADYDAMLAQLLIKANTRGLIEWGEWRDGRVERVKFNPDPVPVMGLTLVYYKKQR